MHFHLEQMKADAGISDAIISAAAEQLDRTITVEFRAADSKPAQTSTAPEPIPDKDDLAVASEHDQSDAVANVLDVLGGEMVNDS